MNFGARVLLAIVVLGLSACNGWVSDRINNVEIVTSISLLNSQGETFQLDAEKGYVSQVITKAALSNGGLGSSKKGMLELITTRGTAVFNLGVDFETETAESLKGLKVPAAITGQRVGLFIKDFQHATGGSDYSYPVPCKSTVEVL